MKTPLMAIVSSGCVLLAVVAVSVWAQDQPAPEPPSDRPALPDLVGALKSTPGCLGLELAEMPSGKRLIFAWFENKKAVVSWYYSEPHQQLVDQFFPQARSSETEPRRPLEEYADDFGPIMIIVSITMAPEPKFKETTLSFSQIAIEMYAPLAGGLFVGGRFAPEGVTVSKMKDYTLR